MFKLAFALASFSILSCPAVAQTPAEKTAAADLVNHLMNSHIALETMAPTGWSITYKPVSVQRGPNDTVIAQIHIFIHGAPAGTVFKQQVVPVGDDKPATEMEGITLGTDGILMCAGRAPIECGDASNPDDPIEFTSSSIKGEPNRLLFVSAAGTISMVVVPNPISAKDRGCTLSAVRLTPGFELALITGTGYPPNTDIHFIKSPGPSGDQVIHSDQRGVFRLSIIPYGPGKSGGTTKFKVNAPSCSPELSYDWANNMRN
jgi:hypothetical protein